MEQINMSLIHKIMNSIASISLQKWSYFRLVKTEETNKIMTMDELSIEDIAIKVRG
jgi:hypothetical protein